MKKLIFTLLLIPLASAGIKTKKMALDTIRISQLPIAAANEVSDDIWMVFNTSGNQTKRMQVGAMKAAQEGCGVFCGSIAITAAELHTCNSIPIEIVPPQGAGTYIRLLDAEVFLTYIAPVYTLGSLLLVSNLSGVYQAISNDILFATADTYSTFRMIQGMDLGNLSENQGLYLIGNISDPLNGNSTIIITYRYKLITL